MAEAFLPVLDWAKTLAWVSAQPASRPNRNQREIIVRIRFLLLLGSNGSIEFTRNLGRMQSLSRVTAQRSAITVHHLIITTTTHHSPLIDTMDRPRRVELRAPRAALQADVAAITQVV